MQFIKRSKLQKFMKCNKCDDDLSSGAKFCSNCGEKVVLSGFWETVKMAQNCWFYLGILQVVSPKYVKSIVEDLKKSCPELYYDYQQAFNFTKKMIKPLIKEAERNIRKKEKR